MDEGIFPQFKKSPPSLQSLNRELQPVTNYRHISISPHIANMFESVVFNHVGLRLFHSSLDFVKGLPLVFLIAVRNLHSNQ